MTSEQDKKDSLDEIVDDVLARLSKHSRAYDELREYFIASEKIERVATSRSRQEAAALPHGIESVGDYALEASIGEGGMGAIYRARQIGSSSSNSTNFSSLSYATTVFWHSPLELITFLALNRFRNATHSTSPKCFDSNRFTLRLLTN